MKQPLELSQMRSFTGKAATQKNRLFFNFFLVISAVVAGGGTSGRGDRPEGLKEPLDSGCREGGS